MHYHIANYAALAASIVNIAHAVDVTIPVTIAADTSFEVSVKDLDSTDKYRVYLAAALGGDTGPTCWLTNSTTLSATNNFTIPAEVGPSASYYSIGVGEVDGDEDDIDYSNKFSFTGGTGNYTQYETDLKGEPFWDANDLPCSAYACARECVDASYPDDLTDSKAYNTMKACVNKCPGVTQTSQTEPAVTTSASASTGTSTSSSSSSSSSSSGDSDDANDSDDDDENGASGAAVQQLMVVGMASVAGFAILFL